MANSMMPHADALLDELLDVKALLGAALMHFDAAKLDADELARLVGLAYSRVGGLVRASEAAGA